MEVKQRDPEFAKSLLAKLTKHKQLSAEEVEILLEGLISLQKSILTVGKKIAHLEYLLVAFLPSVIKIIVSMTEVLKQSQVNTVLLNCIDIYFEYNNEFKIGEYLDVLFDSSRKLYQLNPITAAEQLEMSPNWDFLNALKVGDMVDAVSSREQLVAHWMRGKIHKIQSTFVEVIYEDEYKQIIPLGWKVQPFRSRCFDYDWRKELQKYSKIDAMDSKEVWISSTVVDIEDSFKVTVGFRVYREDMNDYETDDDEHFEGWRSKHDTVMSVFDPRLQRYKTMAKAFTKKANKKQEDRIINDTNDLLYEREYEYQRIYIISRNQLACSRIYYRLVSKFGYRGGFEHILQKLKHQDSTPEQLELYVHIIQRFNISMYRTFVYYYVPKLVDIVEELISTRGDNYVRGLSKDRIINILYDLELIVKRYLSVDEKKFWHQELSLKLAIKCLKSNLLDKKIQGLKMLEEFLKSVKNQCLMTDQTQLMNWIESEKIIQQIYNPSNHIELISRSYDFFRFIVEKCLTGTKFPLIWKLLDLDNVQLKQTLFKFLNDCSKKLKMTAVEYIIDNRYKIQPADVNINVLQLFKEIGNIKDDYSKPLIDYLWTQLINNQKSFKNNDIKQKVADTIVSMVRNLNWRLETKKKLINDALKKPLNKLILGIFSDMFYTNTGGLTELLKQYIYYLINELKTLPIEKYSLLNKIFELLIDIEDRTLKIDEALQNEIINAIQPAGAIQLLTFLSKRKSNKLVFPPPIQLTTSSFKLMMQLFEQNISHHRCNPKQISFYKYLIEVIQIANDDVRELACEVMVNLYVTHYTETDQTQCLKSFLDECIHKTTYPYLRMTRLLIEQIQIDWPFLTFNNIVSSTDQVSIKLINDIHIGSDYSRTFECKTTLNTSVISLYRFAAKKLGYLTQEIKLTIQSNQIFLNQSMKTLEQIKIKDQSIIHCTRRHDYKKKKLVVNSKFISKAAKIFKDVFKSFSTEGFMSKEQFQQFYQRYSFQRLRPDSYKLEDIFSSFGKIKQGYLTSEGFVNYFESEASDSDFFIWGFVQRMGYLPNLRKKQAVVDPKDTIYPTNILLQNPNLYQILFQMLVTTDSRKLQNQIYNLLCRLPLKVEYFNNTSVQEQIVSIENQKNIGLIWYKIATLSFLTKQNPVEVVFKKEIADKWKQAMRDDGIKIIFNCLFKVYHYPDRTHYIYNALLTKLLVLFAELILRKSSSIYPQIRELIPEKIDQLRNPYFVPKHKLPELQICDPFDWLQPRVEFPTSLNDPIMILFIINVVMCDGNGWSLLDKHLEEYKLKQLRSWTLSLSLWSGKFPTQGYIGLINMKEYELCGFMIENYAEKCQINFEQLCENIVVTMLNHKTIEVMNKNLIDRQLIGFFTILESIFRRSHLLIYKYAYLVKQLLYGFLFMEAPIECSAEQVFVQGYQPTKFIKCFSKESRKKAYSLITRITNFEVEQHEQIMEGFVFRTIGRIPTPKRKYSNKSELGYAGLKNLGSTCYMNSILQQFYSNLPLCRAILAIVSEDPFIMELQKMLTYLEFTDRMDFDTQEFFSHVKLGGQQAPPNIQQDAHQFYNFFFEKIENAAKNTIYSPLVPAICRGSFSVQFICQGCQYVGENNEHFYDISLEVKEKNNIYQSLDKLIQGETIQGYNCEKCSSKQDVRKRVVLKELPNNLTIHLQRIIFDLDLMRNKKIHNRIEFPEILQLKNYTYKHLEEPSLNRKQSAAEEDLHKKEPEIDQYSYKLKGVIIHIGTADSGHYYSLIRKDSKWLVFDDSKISQFAGVFENECFGGTVKEEEWLNNAELSDYSQNAYMLMYERIIKQTKSIEFKQLHEKVKFTDLLENFMDIEMEGYHASFKEETLKKVVIDKMWRQVWNDNNTLLQQNMYLCEEFYSFVLDLVNQLPKPYLEQGVTIYMQQLEPKVDNLYEISFKFLSYMVFEVGFAFEIDVRIIAALDSLFKYVPKHAFHILKQYGDIKYLLSSSKQYRLYIKNVYQDALILSVVLSADTIPAQAIKFCEIILAQLNNEIAKNWLKASEILEIVANTMNLNPKYIQFWMSKDIISVIIDFVLEKDSPISLCQKKHSMGNSYQPFSLVPVCQIISNALKYCRTLKDEQLPHQFGYVTYLLSENAKKCLASEQFLKKIIKDRNSVLYLNMFIIHVCLNHKEMTVNVGRFILININRCYNNEDLLLYMNAIQTYLFIEDQFKTLRMQYVLGFAMPTLNSAGSFAITTGIHNHVYTYPTTLAFETKTKSFLDLLCKQKNSYQLFTVMGIQILVGMSLLSESVLSYMLKLPSPTYQYAHYYQWMDDYIINFISESHKFTRADFSANEFGQGVYQCYNQLMDTIKKRFNDTDEAFKKSDKYDPSVSRSQDQQFLYGTTLQISKPKSIVIEPGLELQILDYYVHKILSLPTRNHNKVFPRFLIEHGGAINKYAVDNYNDSRFIQFEVFEIDGEVKRYLVGERAVVDDAIVSFDTVFTNQQHSQKIQTAKKIVVPAAKQLEGQMPSPEKMEIIRSVYISNHTTNKYTLRLTPWSNNPSSMLPLEINTIVEPESTNLVSSLVTKHEVEYCITSKVQAKIEEQQKSIPLPMEIEAPVSVEGIACKSCTYLNSFTSEKCQLCDASLFD